MTGPMLLLAMLAALAPECRAQWIQQSEAGMPGIGPAGQAYALEGAGIVRSEGANELAYEGSAGQDQDEGGYVGGRETQAGDPEAPDVPPKKAPPAPGKSDGPFRPNFSIFPPKAKAQAQSSPIVAKAREFMANPPYNSNNGTHDWTGWCLGFVNTTVRAVKGRGDPQLAKPAAKDAYYAMAAAGRISKDMSNIPPGAALLWAGCSQWGHAAIATGEMSADGSPIMITTSHRGIREMSTKQFGCGLPSGWGGL